MDLSPESIHVIAHLPCLSRLEVPISLIGRLSETRFDKVKTLLMSNSFSGEQRGNISLRSRSLRHLEVHFNRLTRITDSWFRDLPNLETLALSRACFEGYQPTGLPQSNLRVLRMAFCCEIEDFYAPFPRLQDLVFRSIVSADIIKFLRTVNGLRSLAIILKNEHVFPEALLAQIRRFGPTLEELELDGFFAGQPARGLDPPFTFVEADQWHCTSIELTSLRRLIVRPFIETTAASSVMGVGSRSRQPDMEGANMMR